MSPPPSLLLLCSLLALVFFYPAQGYSKNPKCDLPDHGKTLKVMHIYDKCSPFRPSSKSLSWEETVFDMARKDEARLQYLSSLVARRSDAPIASARQIIQSATYIVRVNIGTPAQTLLMAVDTSNDAAWVPCNGCAGCSSKLFDSTKSTSYQTLGCRSPQCKQVHYLHMMLSIIFFIHGLMLICARLYLTAHFRNIYGLILKCTSI